MKRCTVCKEEKELTEFYNSKQSKDGKAYRCKVCDARARAKWQEDNKERSAYSARNRRLKFQYGIDIPEYNRMLTEQDGKCAICGKLEKDNIIHKTAQFLSVDHDHNTGKVRGLLCNQCNRGIGMLGDSVESLETAVRYLKGDTH